MRKLNEWMDSNRVNILDEILEWPKLKGLVDTIESRMQDSEATEEQIELIEVIDMGELIEMLELIKSIESNIRTSATELIELIESMDLTELTELKIFNRQMRVFQEVLLDRVIAMKMRLNT